MKISKGVHKNTVVSFLRDATFFAERGLRLSRRFDYPRALRCFRRAIELDQENASYHCHLASILAEMGKFQESNDILHHVIDNIDPLMEDVYFYLANNYANLEDFETAEEMAMKYLQTATKRSFAEEAEELLDYIYFEMDLPPRHFLDHSADAVFAKHEQARKSLEEGRFLEAIVLLTEINEFDPDFMPAWNNLSLAYYYAGEMDKAMKIVQETLERDSGNLHALCNLAVLLSHQNMVSELLPVIQQLKNVVPFHPEHAYKLATTMGILGQHEEAFRFYHRLLKFPFYADAPTYHYAAISAYLSDHDSQAAKWWQKVKQLDPESGVAEYYLEMIRNREAGTKKEVIPYQYQRLQKPKETAFDEFRTDPMIRASLLWALQHGKEDAKQMVIQTLAMIGDDEAKNTLYSFSQTTHDPQLQKLALLTLSELEAQYPVETPHVQRNEAVSTSEELVAELIRDQIKAGNAEFGKWALAVWSRYCERGTGKELNTVRKIVAWLAALEYSYARKNQDKVTQDFLAKKYGISQATIAKCIKELKELDLYKF
ncbi:tetratricopeptide repeat protein [Brevibacillus sp. SYSU BS000544]|uniref:tetratricopeptide repeat protein n=1 Tax=Brevibacillus sp. SYSU BS000544 TaxID=3416443 RepID=UPI003CE4B758